MNKQCRTIFLGALLLVGMSCGGKQAAPPTSTEASPAPSTEAGPAQELDEDESEVLALVPIPNAVLYEGNTVGGAMTAALLRQSHEAGYRTIVNLRTAEEGGSEEHAALAKELGMSYVHIPIDGADGLTRENAEALDKALALEGSAVVHCASGNRAGALLGLRAYLLRGSSADEAMSIARELGMTSLDEALQSVLTQSRSEP